VHLYRRARRWHRVLERNRIGTELARSADGERSDPDPTERKRTGRQIGIDDLDIVDVLEPDAEYPAGNDDLIARHGNARFERRAPIGGQQVARDFAAAAAEGDVAFRDLVGEFHARFADVAVAEVRLECRELVVAQGDSGHGVPALVVRDSGRGDVYVAAPEELEQIDLYSRRRSTVRESDDAGDSAGGLEDDRPGHHLAVVRDVDVDTLFRAQLIAGSHNRCPADRHVSEREVAAQVRRRQAQAAADAGAGDRMPVGLENGPVDNAQAAGQQDVADRGAVRGQRDGGL